MTNRDHPLPAPAVLPAPILAPTPKAVKRVLEFFIAQINNEWAVRVRIRARPMLRDVTRSAGSNLNSYRYHQISRRRSGLLRVIVLGAGQPDTLIGNGDD